MPSKAKPSNAKPSLRFSHSAALRTQTTKLLTAIDRDDDPTQHANALAALVVGLTEAGLDYYFLLPLREAKMSFVSRQTANLGMAAALRIMSPMIRSILGSAEPAQLRIISRHIRGLM
jgi:hypothetical protein